MKTKSSYVCQECGYDSPQWLGKCPECSAWNSFKEIHNVSISQSSKRTNVVLEQSVTPKKLQEIVYKEKSRIQTEYQELNTVLGGGIVTGSAILIAGDPGVGKSTLLLQLCLSLAKQGKKVLYASGEESVEQIKMRAMRIAQQKTKNEELRTKEMDNLYLISLSNADAIVKVIEDTKPEFAVVDSIQTMESENAAGLSGSVAQVRYATLQFVRTAKQFNIPIVVVGHVTKEGMVAGPMVLSHMVDTVLFLEGEKFAKTRVLRSLKNRFGPVDEVGIFLMEEEGMTEAKNPEELFLTKYEKGVPGTVLTATLEGSRAFLVELQALTVFSKLPMPRRVVSGVDARRVELLLAVLQKHCRLPLDTTDVFVNVAGGLKLSDPAIDLGICLAVYSSLRNIPMDKTVGIAEVGLLGELRSVPGLEKRIREAQKLGFKCIITPQSKKTLMEVMSLFGSIAVK